MVTGNEIVYYLSDSYCQEIKKIAEKSQTSISAISKWSCINMNVGNALLNVG